MLCACACVSALMCICVHLSFSMCVCVLCVHACVKAVAHLKGADMPLSDAQTSPSSTLLHSPCPSQYLCIQPCSCPLPTACAGLLTSPLLGGNWLLMKPPMLLLRLLTALLTLVSVSGGGGLLNSALPKPIILAPVPAELELLATVPGGGGMLLPKPWILP